MIFFVFAIKTSKLVRIEAFVKKRTRGEVLLLLVALVSSGEARTNGRKTTNNKHKAKSREGKT